MYSNPWGGNLGAAKQFRGKEFASQLGYKSPAGKAECRAEEVEEVKPCYDIATELYPRD